MSIAAKKKESAGKSRKTAPAKSQWVYAFGGGKAQGKGNMRNLLGGKGAGLAEMANLGLPVPLGLNDETVEAVAQRANDRRFAYDSYRRFITMYSDVVLGVAHHHFEEILDT